MLAPSDPHASTQQSGFMADSRGALRSRLEFDRRARGACGHIPADVGLRDPPVDVRRMTFRARF
ncbi:MAG: hypothetical protein V9G24_19705 [Rhodoblastus sp.]